MGPGSFWIVRFFVHSCRNAIIDPEKPGPLATRSLYSLFSILFSANTLFVKLVSRFRHRISVTALILQAHVSVVEEEGDL